uniref:Uncharacterized protein n=1 Tax=Periophthalmus magnuspinnatus TaxID=409849 RepID=A0A3B4B0K7_9GOBI
MSSQQGSSGWSLETLGLSQKELVLAEALQMEYDALSRIKQDRTQDRTQNPTRTQNQTQDRTQYWTQNLSRICILSGSDPTLDQPGGSQQTPTPAEVPGPGVRVLKEPLYIMEAPELSKPTDPQTSCFSDDDIPPAVPQSQLNLCCQSLNLQIEDTYKFFSFTVYGQATLNQSLLKLNETPPPRPHRDQSGKPVARSKTLPPQVPPRTYLPATKTNRNQRRVSADPVCSRSSGFGYELFQVSEERDEEVAAFCHMLDVLRSAFPHSDPVSNSGFVWSPSLSPELIHGLEVSVRVCVSCEGVREPLTFTCDGSSTVDLLIYQTLCYTQDQEDLDVNQFLMKVCGLDEYLPKKCYALELKLYSNVIKCFSQREDDETSSSMNHSILLQERPIKQTVTRWECSLTHVESLHVERLVQSVKALCSSLASIETPEITAALNLLPACPCRVTPKVTKDASALALREKRELVVEKLTAAILELVHLYCSTFNANFQPTAHSLISTAPVQEAGLVSTLLSFNVYAAHRVPITWAASYEGFFLTCSLTHGGAELCAPQHTSKQNVSKYLFHLVTWDQR